MTKRDLLLSISLLYEGEWDKMYNHIKNHIDPPYNSEETGIPILDLDKIFYHTPSEKLLPEMKNFLTTYHQKVLLLDNKKLLYAKNSQIDLLAFLKELSKDIPVVATWNGKIEDGQLFHFRNDSSEDLIYSTDNNDFKYILC